jgi:hypothetical protein
MPSLRSTACRSRPARSGARSASRAASSTVLRHRDPRHDGPNVRTSRRGRAPGRSGSRPPRTRIRSN